MSDGEDVPVTTTVVENTNSYEERFSPNENGNSCEESALLMEENISSTDQEETNEESLEVPIVSQLITNSDIFDAELDSDSERKTSSGLLDEDRETEALNEDDDDDGEDDKEISSGLKKRLAKGAAKKGKRPTSERRSNFKNTQDDLMQIHSGTQKLIRESRVQLPYHKPEKQELSTFLDRIKMKRQMFGLSSVGNTPTLDSTPPPWKVAPHPINPDHQSVSSSSAFSFHAPCLSARSAVEDNVTKKSFSMGDNEESVEGPGEDLMTRLKRRLINDFEKEEEHNGVIENEEDNLVQCDSSDRQSPSEKDFTLEETIKDDLLSKELPSDGIASVPITAQSEIIQENITLSTERPSTSFEENMPSTSTQLNDDLTFDHRAGKATALTALIYQSVDSDILATVPKLRKSSAEADEIVIDDNPGGFFGKLQKQFVSKPKKPATSVEINTVVKLQSNDEKQFKMEKLVYKMDDKEEIKSVKLDLLKEQLQKQMRDVRTERLQERYETYKQLVSDLGVQRLEEDPEEEEEIDDGDDSSVSNGNESSDDDDDDAIDEVEEGEDDEEAAIEKQERANPFIDDEADEEDDCEEDEITEIRRQQKNIESDDDDAEVQSSHRSKPLKVIDDDDDDEDLSNGFQASSKSLHVSTSNMKDITEDDNDGGDDDDDDDDNAEEANDGSEKPSLNLFNVDGDDALFTQKSNVTYEKRSVSSRPFQVLGGRTGSEVSSNKNTESQDIEVTSSLIPAGQLSDISSSYNRRDMPRHQLDDSTAVTATQDFEDLPSSSASEFYIADTPSDVDWLLNNSVLPTSQAVKQICTTSENAGLKEDDILDYCSGKFEERPSKLTQSGFLASQIASSSEEINASRKRKRDFSDNEDEDAAGDDDDDDDDYENKESDSEDEELKIEKRDKYLQIKSNGKINKLFVEDEAELSGSEAGSADEDDNGDDDEMEMEEGDNDDVGTEEDLMNQVHRAHLKTLIDQDKRQISLLKEQLLEDGDLHEDGYGRMRWFRWNNTEFGDEENKVVNDESDNDDLEEADSEAKWRMDRLEREKFLRQQQEEDDDNDDDVRSPEGIFKSTKLKLVTTPLIAQKDTPLQQKSISRIGLPSKVVNSATKKAFGSFLCRSKESLAKFSDSARSFPSNDGTTTASKTVSRNSRNFVFASLSSPAKSNSTKEAPSKSSMPLKKRLCLEVRDDPVPASRMLKFLDKSSQR